MTLLIESQEDDVLKFYVVRQIPPIHTLGQTWTKQVKKQKEYTDLLLQNDAKNELPFQDNPEVTDQTRHIPKLEHDYGRVALIVFLYHFTFCVPKSDVHLTILDSMALDGDDASASGEKVMIFPNLSRKSYT